MANITPEIGHWFRRPGGALFEVVAIDDEASTIEIQLFDGTIDEVDAESWPDLRPVEVSAPEDWSGSVDMDPEDFAGNSDGDLPPGFHNPLAFLDRE
ncbi:MAG: DUF6763 family protein [Pseudomonadota bacterium]